MKFLRKILFPVVPIYYLVTWLRNTLYDLGIKKSVAYDFPVLAVGNLSVGGTGKSPMVEYLITLLQEKTQLAILSRGYKRKTKGFRLVDVLSEAKDVGDEPLQFKRKFPNVYVGVDENRRNGITNLRTLHPKPDVILLDDAYQHRKVKAGLYMLLTAYYDLYCNDIVLPTGNLREPRQGANRADVIVVTKCPVRITDQEKNRLQKKLRIKSHQSLFFTTINYGKELIGVSGKRSLETFKNRTFTLVTGIANPKSLLDYYRSYGLLFTHLNFADHHEFTTPELKMLENAETIITTEKDYMRLVDTISHNNLWYQPITIQFIGDKEGFNSRIFKYVENNL
ncbi:tetraacyldisaccharide 4'-kinase [Aquimarina sp. U1-2]|uniref:tetraacyldisaccharide 4'-kinase n=1 Tax=Aquimarina sp. U1-2 TaxID=2823141 RepID=UPI001AECED72|nr:tetraacyldisaccharide 4'-kinase [Aquimarina sp. U1-2]MBP2830822.1 tetraacyldisaccharide 4'-kinase [Aquimarina sp. U1-2]